MEYIIARASETDSGKMGGDHDGNPAAYDYPRECLFDVLSCTVYCVTIDQKSHIKKNK